MIDLFFYTHTHAERGGGGGGGPLVSLGSFGGAGWDDVDFFSRG